MKINPVAIQSYQQITGNGQPSQKQVEGKAPAQKTSTVSIVPQEKQASSRLAVRPSGGNYADFLSTEERQALEMLFNRFRDTERFGSSFQADQKADTSPSLGRVVDIKI